MKLTRQFNFSCTKNELEILLEHLNSQNLLAIPDTGQSQDFFMRNCINEIRNTTFGKYYILKKSDLGKVKIDVTKSNKVYFVDGRRSPVIELWLQITIQKTKEKSSRLFFDLGYLSDSGDVILKEEDFLATANELLLWVKKNL